MFVFSSAVALAALPLPAQVTAKDISARLTGKSLYLRGFWAADQLTFDADGESVTASEILPFTESGIDVKSVKLKDKKLLIEGQRMVWSSMLRVL
jgi:hypothetical protein